MINSFSYWFNTPVDYVTRFSTLNSIIRFHFSYYFNGLIDINWLIDTLMLPDAHPCPFYFETTPEMYIFTLNYKGVRLDIGLLLTHSVPSHYGNSILIFISAELLVSHTIID